MALQRSLGGSWLLFLTLLGASLRASGDVTLRASATHSHPMEGHTTQLICEVHSMNRSQVIVWSKDQMSITWGNAMGQMMSPRFELGMTSMGGGMTTYNLTIHDITRDDDGRYQCQVLEVSGNGYSAMASDTVVLSVLYFPGSAFPRCSLNGSQTFLSGTELRVACSSESGNPQVTSRWIVTGGAEAPAAAQPRFVTAEASAMVVSELELVVSPALHGLTYVCQVTSPVFVDHERSCSLGPLRVLDWPVVRVARSVSRSPQGTDVHFTCHVEPEIPGLEWATSPEVDPSRLVWTDEGSVMTVRNLRASDNGTEVICRVPFQDTSVEARSVILLAGDDGAWIYPVTPPYDIASELCIPWFAAFLFAVAVNFILCVMIVRLLFQNKRLASKLESSKPGALSRQDVEGEPLAPRRKSTILTWPSGSLNWSNMPSETQLRDHRHMSWQHLPPTDDAEAPGAPEPQTYTELSPDTMDGKGKVQRKRTRRAVSMPRIGTTDSDSYVTPDAAVPKPAKSQQQQKAGSAPASKAGGRPRKTGTVETVSGRVSSGQSPAVSTSVSAEMDSYMPLDESQIEAPKQRSNYQSLQKAPKTARSPSKQAGTTSLRRKLSAAATKAGEDDPDEMTGDSGVYNGESVGPSRKREPSAAKSRQGSMMGESATYMPVGSLAKRQASASVKNAGQRGADATYSAGVMDDDMGEGIYGKAAGNKHLPRPQKLPTSAPSSRAPAATPAAGGRHDEEGPSTTDDSCREPDSDSKSPQSSPDYFTLEPPDRGEYNYGADISSESDSYQYQAVACDWRAGGRAESARRPDAKRTADSRKGPPAAAGRAASPASDTSYLELEDVEGETRGYMDMVKTKTAGRPKAQAPPAKAATSAGPARPDADTSSGEDYLPMEGVSPEYEYSIPTSNKLQPKAEDSAVGAARTPGPNPSKKKSARNQPKKKSAWSFPKW